MNNLDLMRMRLTHEGGIKQEDRMIKAKRRTLDKVVLYSYQACDIAEIPHKLTTLEYREKITGLTEEEAQIKKSLISTSNHLMRALINPDKVKQDYDDKILSIPYECDIRSGDIIRWYGTNSYWLVYLPELTEDSYFRSGLRRCRYTISWKDEDGSLQSTWAAIRGPVETKINTVSKAGLKVDTPNLTLNILMPKTKATLKMFQRYSRFLFEGLCWQVQAPDSISMENVIEVNAMENYINDFQDDNVVNDLIIEKNDPNQNSSIIGETFIKPGIEYLFEAPEGKEGIWSIKNDCKISKIIKQTGNNVIVKWEKMTSGQFTLLFTTNNEIIEKIIVVESLF